MLSILPNDKWAVKRCYMVTISLCVAIFASYTTAATRGILAAVSEDERCYSHQLSPLAEKDARVPCGWVVLANVRLYIVASCAAALAIWLVQGLRTTQDSGPLLERIFPSEYGIRL